MLWASKRYIHLSNMSKISKINDNCHFPSLLTQSLAQNISAMTDEQQQMSFVIRSSLSSDIIALYFLLSS